MRTITKGSEPATLKAWNTTYPHSVYSDLANHIPQGPQVRVDIKTACLIEQYYLCAYCCDRISLNDSHNEHILPQTTNPQFSLVFNNIIASCQSSKHCGHFKGKKEITLTPLMTACEVEIKYNLNGTMTHSTPRGQNFITATGLNNKGLINKRRQLVELLIFSQIDDDELSILDDEMLGLLIADLNIPSTDQKLEAFSPVLCRILTDFIT